MQAASSLERSRTTCVQCRGSGTVACAQCGGKGTVKPAAANKQARLVLNKCARPAKPPQSLQDAQASWGLLLLQGARPVW